MSPRRERLLTIAFAAITQLFTLPFFRVGKKRVERQVQTNKCSYEQIEWREMINVVNVTNVRLVICSSLILGSVGRAVINSLESFGAGRKPRSTHNAV
jgi:hypothetical protein